MALLDDAKAACRVTSNAYDNELTDLITAGFADIGITDVNASMLVESDALNPLVKRAVLTYVKLNFGDMDDGVYDRLKASYDEQKSQMLMSSTFTDWGVLNA